MTEAEALELVLFSVDNAIGSLSLFVSVTCAYMTVAYVVGSKLSRFQALAVSGLYIFTAGVFIITTYVHVRTWGELQRGVPEGITAMNNVALWNESFWAYYSTSACVIGMGICLYFMWDVRHPKPE